MDTSMVRVNGYLRGEGEWIPQFKITNYNLKSKIQYLSCIVGLSNK